MVADLSRRVARALTHDVRGFLAAVHGAKALRRGLHSYKIRSNGGERRIHLRIEPDGSGVLFLDVSETLHLNNSAVWISKLALDGISERKALGILSRDFPPQDMPRLREDARRIYVLLQRLQAEPALCFSCACQGLLRNALFSAAVNAPYKADIALLYYCNNHCFHCYNEASRRGMRSLSVREWYRVLDRLARIGIPHLIFTGGEPTLYAALPQLIRHADSLGCIVGLNTNGRRLADPGYTARLVASGLNHVQITLESARPDVHNRITGSRSFDETIGGIVQVLASGAHVITNTTLMRLNADHMGETIEFLHSLGVRRFAVNGMIHSGRGSGHIQALAEEDLEPILVRVKSCAERLGMEFLWYTPTEYCRFSPLSLNMGYKRCNAAQYSVCIEPNGDVLPCQSYYEAAGNLLRDSWEEIWQSPLFLSFRDRTRDPKACGLASKCWECPDLAVCGGGCPLFRRSREENECTECQASA